MEERLDMAAQFQPVTEHASDEAATSVSEPSAGFTVLRADRAASPVEVGATVYRCRGWDYGSANEDTRRLRLEHVSVTLDPTGDYPFFTIPREDLTVLGGRS